MIFNHLFIGRRNPDGSWALPHPVWNDPFIEGVGEMSHVDCCVAAGGPGGGFGDGPRLRTVGLWSGWIQVGDSDATAFPPTESDWFDLHQLDDKGQWRAVSVAAIGGVVHIVGIQASDSTVWHTTMPWQEQGVITPWQQLTTAALPSAATDVSISAVGDELHVVLLTAAPTADLYHTRALADGAWPDPFGSISGQESLPAGFALAFSAVATAGIGTDLHVVSLHQQRILHTIRHADGTWASIYGDVNGQCPDLPTSGMIAVAAAGVAGSLQIGVSTQRTVFHTLRNPDGTWTPGGSVPGLINIATPAQHFFPFACLAMTEVLPGVLALTTDLPPASPLISTPTATVIGSTWATLQSSINSYGEPVDVTFTFQRTPGVGIPLRAASSQNDVLYDRPVSVDIAGLAEAAEYITNVLVTRTGDGAVFQTPVEGTFATGFTAAPAPSGSVQIELVNGGGDMSTLTAPVLPGSQAPSGALITNITSLESFDFTLSFAGAAAADAAPGGFVTQFNGRSLFAGGWTAHVPNPPDLLDSVSIRVDWIL